MIRKVTPAQEQYIRDNYLLVSTRELGVILGHPRGTIMSVLRRLKLRTPKELANKRRADARVGKTTATTKEDDFIKANYLTMPIKTIAEKLGRSGTFVSGRLKKLHLIIPAEVTQARKEESRIKKGNTPPNKGRKQSEYMTPEAIARTVGTRFKKGEPNHNTLYDGAIRIRTDHQERNGKKYKWIRLSKAKWVALHVYNWEKKHGPVPEGYIVAFKTPDTMNCEADNLELITRAENMRRNTIHRYPAEVKQIIRLTNKLSKKIKTKKDEQRNN